jgi:CheY-like chemotaxis protein
MTILYVEDDPDDRELFKEAVLKISPHTVCHILENGRQALTYVREHVIVPDYIFLDINLPEMSGTEVLKIMKRTDSLKNIPVVVFSTSVSESDIEECKKLGAIDFVSKPSSFPEICMVLKKFI